MVIITQCVLCAHNKERKQINDWEVILLACKTTHVTPRRKSGTTMNNKEDDAIQRQIDNCPFVTIKLPMCSQCCS